MRPLLICFLILFSKPVFANPEHPDLKPFSSLLNADLYAGFGLARDMINHVYKDQPFQPRDYDLAVIGSDLSEEQALALLERFGKIIKTIQMHREVIKPGGNVFAFHYGFVIIIDAQGIQIDFKFFKTVEDAHTRGLFDVEKLLIPLKNRSIVEVVSDLKDHKLRGRHFEMSDPHDGLTSILTQTPKTVNWAKAKGSSLDWIIRGAMINAKLGGKGFLPSERKLMIERLKTIQYIRETDLALIKRALAHKKSARVKELLTDLGFFEQLKKWRWNTPALEMVELWNRLPASMSCKKLI